MLGLMPVLSLFHHSWCILTNCDKNFEILIFVVKRVLNKRNNEMGLLLFASYFEILLLILKSLKSKRPILALTTTRKYFVSKIF